MTDPPTPIQLPGVKGQWILAAECPPDRALPRWNGHDITKYEATPDEQYWRPLHHDDPRPFTLPAETTPQHTETVGRKYDKLISHHNGKSILAVADDGTAWVANDTYGGTYDWRQLTSLPDREVGQA